MPQLPRVNPRIDGNATSTFGFKPLDYWEIDTHANLAASNGPNGALAAVIRVVEQNATIEILGSTNVANLIGNGGSAVSSPNSTVRVVTTVHGSWPDAATLQTAIRALGTVDGQNLAGTTVYSFSF